MEDDYSLLARTALFEGITREEIAALCGAYRCRSAHYPKGSVLWRREERVTRAGIVLSGCVQAEQNGADGTLRIAARHGPGALFGDVLTASRAQTSPVDIVAAEDTRVLFLPLTELVRGGGGAPRAAEERFRLNLLAELSDKYWGLYRRLGYLSAPTTRAKLARRLLAEGKPQFTLRQTREALAAELGVNRSAMSRELGGLAREGLLTVRRGSFTLHDVPALRRIAEG